MHSQITEFENHLTAHGWKVAEIRNVSYLWVAEIWKVQSTWTPTNCYVYLSFESDFHHNANDFSKIAWLRAYPYPPVDWLGDSNADDHWKERENSNRLTASVPIGRRRDKYLKEFFSDLARMRNECL